MNQQDLTNFLMDLGHVMVVVGSEANGNPELAWEDSFFFMTDAAGESPKMPFATLVSKE